MFEPALKPPPRRLWSPQPPDALPQAGMGAAAAPYPPRAPKAPPPRKAAFAAECLQLEQLPNIGPSIAADLRDIGIDTPAQLLQQDAWHLYQRLCEHSGQRQDPCVLDTFMAAADFMGGAAPLPWWHYTAQRKARYGKL